MTYNYAINGSNNSVIAIGDCMKVVLIPENKKDIEYHKQKKDRGNLTNDIHYRFY